MYFNFLTSQKKNGFATKSTYCWTVQWKLFNCNFFKEKNMSNTRTKITYYSPSVTEVLLVICYRQMNQLI